jgi:hypothetical protein
VLGGKEGLPAFCGKPAKGWISLLRFFGKGGKYGVPGRVGCSRQNRGYSTQTQ